jgi:hypothetical protein
MPPGPPPKKKKDDSDDLAEVDRALSVLKGRHPEHERLEREDRQSRTRRAAEHEEAARIASSEARSRQLRLLAIIGPVVALVAFIGILGRREMERRAHLTQAATPFVSVGFTTLETSSPSSTGTLEASVDPGCMVAVSTGTEPLVITRGGATTNGPGPALFCTCANERISITGAVESGGGLVLLRADAALIGGSRAFPFSPFKPGTTIKSDDACSEAALDAWIDAKRYPKATVDDAWLRAEPGRAPLVAAGFHVIAALPASSPFVVVDVPKDSCTIAASSDPTDKIALRTKGGTLAVTDATGGFVRCAQTEGTMAVTREGKGDVVVLTAPAVASGGILGARDIAKASGISASVSTVPPADRGWDARQLMLVSQIPEGTITTAGAPDVPVDRDARVVALSFETPNALVPETPEEVYSFCDPPLDKKTLESFCVFSGPQKWRAEGADAVGGIARSKLPFWLFAMQSANDPVALKGMTQLFVLARRLGREGFAPTTLEALTELPNGVEVLGRTGEDAVVAVGVVSVAPWVYPLSDDPPWSLDGEPRVVPVKPLSKVTLTTPLKNLPPKGSRRTVVFRRATKP